tara:strand:- start:112 stop:642 length:531 start_codon:yes stop_codon:yes gene_type:complete
MRLFNNNNQYGLVAKLFHWTTFVVLLAQIPLGFYLVGLEFSDERIELENIHILIGITVFYLTLLRLIWKFFNQSATGKAEAFKGQILIAKFNHFLLYISILTITISGILKKLYMGEKLNFIFFNYGFEESNFQLADSFYQLHIYANYLLITLISIHVAAVIIHHVIFKDKILKKIT